MRATALRLVVSALVLGPSCQGDDAAPGQDDSSTGDDSSTVGSVSIGSTSVTSATSTSAGTTSSTTDATLDTSADSTSASTSETADASTGVPTDCGNGELDDGEVCDDHNTIDGDGCNADCMPGGQEIWTVVLDAGFQRNDRANAVAIDADDDIYVAGWAGNMSGQIDGFLVKLDDDGQLQWTEAHESGVGNDSFEGVAVLEDQSVVVVGFHAVMGGGVEAIVRCYSEAGDVLWTHSEPDIGDSVGFDVAVDSLGDIVVAGSGHDPMDGSVVEWLAKFAPDGDVLWNQRIALEWNLLSVSIALDSSDAIVLAGLNGPAVTTKLDADGNELWTYSGDDSIPASAFDVATASDDGIFVAGSGAANHTYFAHHPTDGIAPDWTEAWIGSFGGMASAEGVAVDGADRTIWVGRESTPLSVHSPYVRKLDTDHSVAWTLSVTALPSGFDGASDVAIDSLDQPVVVGQQRDDDGDDDLWIVRLTQ